jgi:hypothetical protein
VSIRDLLRRTYAVTIPDQADSSVIWWTDGPTLQSVGALLTEYGCTSVTVYRVAAVCRDADGTDQQLTRLYRPSTYVLWLLRGEDRNGSVRLGDTTFPAGGYTAQSAAEQVAVCLITDAVGNDPHGKFDLDRVDTAIASFGGVAGLLDAGTLAARTSGPLR